MKLKKVEDMKKEKRERRGNTMDTKGLNALYIVQPITKEKDRLTQLLRPGNCIAQITPNDVQ